ncbi:STAS domain-containing protein [Kitasatospora sp. NPDC001660]
MSGRQHAHHEAVSVLQVASRDLTVPVRVCRVEGEVDRDTRPALDDALGKAVAGGPALLVVDLGPITFCDSACLNSLLVARKDAEEAGVWLVLTGLGPQVRLLQPADGGPRA